MPSVSGWALRPSRYEVLRCGDASAFLCPRFRAGLCDQLIGCIAATSDADGFYALGFGLGFATVS